MLSAMDIQVREERQRMDQTVDGLVREINKLNENQISLFHRTAATEKLTVDHEVRQVAQETVLTNIQSNMARQQQMLLTMRKEQEDRAARWEEVDRRMVQLERGGPREGGGQQRMGSNDPRMEASFFIGGIMQLKAHFGMAPEDDPLKVAYYLMGKLACSCSVDGIIPADRQAASRGQMNGVVVFMRTPHHKKDALIRVKTYMKDERLDRGNVRDCFPGAEMEAAKGLIRRGADMKQKKEIDRYRVVNSRGKAVLQVAVGSGWFEDVDRWSGGQERMEIDGNRRGGRGGEAEGQEERRTGTRSKISGSNVVPVGPIAPLGPTAGGHPPLLVGLQPVQDRTTQAAKVDQQRNQAQQPRKEPQPQGAAAAQPQAQPLEQRGPRPRDNDRRSQGPQDQRLQQQQRNREQQQGQGRTGYERDLQQREQRDQQRREQYGRYSASDSDNRKSREQPKGNTSENAWEYCGTAATGEHAAHFKNGQGNRSPRNDLRNGN
jgi:hypothetical protein